MNQQVATITLNSTYDLIGLTDSIKQGEVNPAETAGLHATDKGINFAKILKQLALSVTAGSFLGKKIEIGFKKPDIKLTCKNVFS
ncbi:MAG: hypothetical protein AB8W37_00020 [Arsenophonus endosymbiont of Dermacentor nuttalli]